MKQKPKIINASKGFFRNVKKYVGRTLDRVNLDYFASHLQQFFFICSHSSNCIDFASL